MSLQDASLKPILEKLEAVFNIFNEEFYHGELKKPVITVSPDMTSGAYGWATSWKAWKHEKLENKEDGYYEINICAEHLARPFEETCATLLHEMAHLYALQNDIKDTSRGGSYHNKKYKQIAEQHGLTVEQDEKYGWTITKLDQHAHILVDSLGEQKFEIYRTKMVKAKKGGSKSSSRKYVCPDCGMIIRATKDVNLMCGDCKVSLELEEQ